MKNPILVNHIGKPTKHEYIGIKKGKLKGPIPSEVYFCVFRCTELFSERVYGYVDCKKDARIFYGSDKVLR